MSSHKSLGGRPVSRKFWPTQFSLLARRTRHQAERKNKAARLRIGHARDQHIDLPHREYALEAASITPTSEGKHLRAWNSTRMTRIVAQEWRWGLKLKCGKPITRCLIESACVL